MIYCSTIIFIYNFVVLSDKPYVRNVRIKKQSAYLAQRISIERDEEKPGNSNSTHVKKGGRNKNNVELEGLLGKDTKNFFDTLIKNIHPL